jgi:4-hydroxyphenylpyruvate dioxygenase
MPGQGDLPVVDFTRAVVATGYDGPLSLEIFNDQFRGGSPKSIAVDGRRSLVYLMDQVGRAEPAIVQMASRLPDRVAVSGVAFVEFSADEQEGQRLRALLRAMGFTERGRHKNRDVTRFGQGGINIVVNTEKEGFAHAAYLVHGTSAYAMGLEVEDAAATVERARALGAEPFAERRGPGELRIPAIRGVGGGVIYFLDRGSELAHVWDVEFEPIGEPATSGAGLTRIDHVAQTMNYEEMLTWMLFYLSIFSTRKLPMVDVVDPGGLVRSQVIESAGGELRLTLNGAESRRTLAGHFISESVGSSIQHLAFASDDIFATADRIAALGFSPLEISTNYYDDLEARFGLEQDLTERLRTRQILYDRDADHRSGLRHAGPRREHPPPPTRQSRPPKGCPASTCFKGGGSRSQPG